MSNYPTLQLNDTGSYVRIAQQLLRILDLYPASVTGSFDTTTMSAVKAFQRSNNLNVTGIIDSETWNLLISQTKNMERQTVDLPTLELGSSGEDVELLQEMLKTTLYYDGGITGEYDQELENTVKTYQFNNNILADGVTNDETWDSLISTYSSLIDCDLTADIDGDTDKYVVQKGDTLYSLAKKFNTTVDQLKKLNNLTGNTLVVGSTLFVPKSNSSVPSDHYYTVKKGDTLYSISKAYNVPIDLLKSANNLTSNTLSVGQQLVIPSTTSNYQTYTVKRGDTLYSIAREFGVSIDELMRVNNLSSSVLSIGQNLVIPTNTSNINYKTYVVQKGDTLYSIARNFNVSVDSIVNLNNLTSNVLSVNQKLLIPNT